MTKKHKNILLVSVVTSGVVIAVMVFIWTADSSRITLNQAFEVSPEKWVFEVSPEKWVPVAIESSGEFRLDYAWKDKLYEGPKRWPWHVKVSFKATPDGEIRDGAVPRNYLLSNVKGAKNLVIRRRNESVK